jgi:hypothetical protein
MRFRLNTLALGALVAAGCAATQPIGVTGEPTPVELSVKTEIRGAPFKVQAVVNPYTGNDVEHVVLSLLTVSGGNETAVLAGGNPVTADVPKLKLADVLRFGNLKLNTTYRIRALAYKAAGTGAGDLISVANQLVDVAVTNNDRPGLATLGIQLIDKTFAAEATTSISFSNGAVNNTASSEFIQLSSFGGN